MTADRGIHYRRRWFYALWVALLLLSLGAFALWQRPRAIDQAPLQIQIQVRQAPAGTGVQVWAGPWHQWQGLGWSGEGAVSTVLRAEGATRLPLLTIPIARRRWVKDYIRRDSWELVMLKLTAPGEQPRYFALPLSQDIRTGLLRSRAKLITSISVSWSSLRVDGRAPDRIP